MKYVITYTVNGQTGSTKAFSEETKDDMVKWMTAEGRVVTSVEEV